MRTAVIDYDLGNLPSVTKALERIGVSAEIVERGDELDDAFDAVVLPGVGHFGAGARNLKERGFDVALKQWANDRKPLLGICVGLQLFMESSEEEPGAEGLGIVKGTCRRLRGDGLKVPHMGWNTLDVKRGARVASAIADESRAYFVHSFYVDPEPSSVAATTTYDETFCSVVEQDNVVGVQFHPEKSADVGRRVLEAFFTQVVR
jgi:glutamine amidotransferase